MDITIATFGEFTLTSAGSRVEVGSGKQRLMLALLVLRANTPVRIGELIEVMWEGSPPLSARKNLQVHASRLRRFLGRRLTYTRGGYRLDLGPESCDLVSFERLVAEGERAARDGDTQGAADLLGRAVELWTDRPLAEFDDVSAISDAVDTLRESYWSSLERWAELRVGQGRHEAVLDRLQPYARRELLRERLAAVWMASLAADGRPNDALAHFAEVRQALARDLGLSPGPALVRLQARLLETLSAPAGRSGPGNQLPRGLSDFVGRSAQLDHAVARLRTGREVVVVCGPVGIGKSAFALHVAHLVSSSFPDGAIRVEAGGTSPAPVLRDLLETAGLAETGSVRNDLARWRAWLAERRVLIVLDGAVDESVVSALLPGSGGSRAIVTSCFRLSGIEGPTRLDLPPLTEAEGVDLLGRIVGLSRILADPRAARRIVALCEGLPLAVRATATRLDSLRHFRLADYTDRLERQPRLLDEMRSGGLVLSDRYREFWRGLPKGSRRAFLRLLDLVPAGAPEHPGPVPVGPVDLPPATVEPLLECNLLAVPQAEVSAHVLAYGVSRFACEFARAQGPD